MLDIKKLNFNGKNNFVPQYCKSRNVKTFSNVHRPIMKLNPDFLKTLQHMKLENIFTGLVLIRNNFPWKFRGPVTNSTFIFLGINNTVDSGEMPG